MLYELAMIIMCVIERLLSRPILGIRFDRGDPESEIVRQFKIGLAVFFLRLIAMMIIGSVLNNFMEAYDNLRICLLLIAVLFLATNMIMASIGHVVSGRRTYPEEVVRCPICGEPMDGGYDFCERCGYEMKKQ